MRRFLVWFADSHAGSVYGLCNPDAWLSDGDRDPYHPALTSGQRLYWDWMLEFIEKVKSVTGKQRVDVMHGGDICQGTKHLDGLMSTRMGDHIAIAAANMAPWMALPNAKSLTLFSGTGAHDFGEGSAEETVAKVLGKKVRMSHHELIDIDGLLVDAAHHGPGAGKRDWLKGNVARFYLQSAIQMDNPPANIYLRGHVHDSIWVSLFYHHKMYHLFVAPSWQLPGGYVEQQGQSPSAAVAGGWILEITDGRMTNAYEVPFEFPLRKRVTL